ncbi:MAG: PEP-CTERM sorting domain-containing protein [Planctomycetota bacterium]
MSSATSHASSLSFFSLTDSFMNLPSSYVFGTAITGSATFSNKTLAGIGLTNQGSYVYTFGSGANTDTVTFNIGGSGGGGGGGQVPEPSTMAIFGLGALGMAYRARRKAKA